MGVAADRGCVKTPDRNEHGEQSPPALNPVNRNAEFQSAVCLNSAACDGASSKAFYLSKSGLRFHTASTQSGRAIAWVLAVVMLLANVAGYVFNLYQRFRWFDRILHACTLFALTFWAAVFLCGKVLNGSVGHRLIRVLLIASVGIALGAWWEVAEWGFDQVMPANVIKGKFDTVLGLIMDSFGAFLAAWLSLKVMRPPTELPPREGEPIPAERRIS
jgi:hypothetical protein